MPVKAGGVWEMLTGGRVASVNSHVQKPFGEHGEKCLTQLPPQDGRLHFGEKKEMSELAKSGEIESTNQVADESDPPEVVKNFISNYIQENQEQGRNFQQDKPPALDDDSQLIIASPFPRLEVPKEVSLSNASTPGSIHDIDEMPSISRAACPRDDKMVDDKAAERYNDSSGPSYKRSGKNALPAALTACPPGRDWNQHRPNRTGKDRLLSGSPRNSEERLDRSLSPRRRCSREYLHDRRYRERSLSPRRHSGRRCSEDRWHRERHDHRYYRHQENPRGRRDGRMQNQNQLGGCAAVQTSNAQQQIASNAQVPLQSRAFPHAPINQYPLLSNEQCHNVQNNQLCNQMWQYCYYTQQQQQQQQLLLQQQQPSQQQRLQQIQLSEQQMDNQQQQMQPPQQTQQITSCQQQLFLQFYQQQFKQHLRADQPHPQQQQLQSEQQLQLLQQEFQQPQMQHEAVNLPQLQQQAYQYQELQKQEYLLYLQQLQLYQRSQEQPGVSQDQQSLQQQQNFPGQQDGQEKLPEMQNGDEKPQYQHDDGRRQVSSHYIMVFDCFALIYTGIIF